MDFKYRRWLAASTAALGLSLGITAGALADASPNGPGQPGAPGTTCGSPNATSTPGNAANSPGSPFNPDGQSGQVYAGNPGTASLAHSNSTHAVSQYDIACFQNSQPH
jgi:hypothetical protein